ncbi:MAG TPA: non-heme iron oxygenase ferredoxin subunit [Candidatus Sulfotelmatobacter sp.]|nr:non-heme iron oxygenase ferredoxin subunit [Candidatus Sulfotelmatobacter sp.]
MSRGMEAWRRVAALSEVTDGKPLAIVVDGAALALYRVGRAVCAVSDVCTHEYVRLSGGRLSGTVIECPLHHARFDVVTGRCLARPAEHDLMTYAVRVEDDTVFVRVAPAC